ncbi:hypothetical protein D3C73_946980 [compost metagenome]
MRILFNETKLPTIIIATVNLQAASTRSDITFAPFFDLLTGPLPIIGVIYRLE